MKGLVIMGILKISSIICLSVCLTICLLLAGPAGATSSKTTSTTSQPGIELPDKALTLDGRYVHDVGQVWHHVTNWGLLGSAYSVQSTLFADSPSCMWPAGSGDEYLWAAGLWVGGVKLGEELVSAGGWASEWRPSEAAGDTIHRTALGAAGGARYPAPDADDDGDGLEDEEILNGLDDDGDGLVDEDYAAYGDQHFVCTYRDNEGLAVEQMPDHTPMDLEVVQQSIQWALPGYNEFVGYDFTITNIGVVTLEQLYVGMFSDNDIGPRSYAGAAGDDMAGFASETVDLPGGQSVPVQVAYMYDGAAQPVPGYVGWVLLDHTTDSTGLAAPAAPAVLSYQRFSGNASFEMGGDPTNDTEAYDLMSRDQHDPDALPGQTADYRVLMSSGPFATLAPGESLRYQVALVMGAGLDEMLANAARARLAYAGQAFDRDGDAANGAEYIAHWLLEAEVEVPAEAGWIDALRVPGGVQVMVETSVVSVDDLMVERLQDGEVTRRWYGDELLPAGLAEGHTVFRFIDTDAPQGTVIYRLARLGQGGQLTLDQTSFEGQAARLVMSAAPNPFNPQVNIKLDLPRRMEVTLEAFDARGHRVRTLVGEVMDAGLQTVVWRGDDEAGRSLPSGVYHLRLKGEGELFTTRVTLMR